MHMDEEWSFQMEQFKKEEELREFEILDDKATIMNKHEDIALVRCYDSYSPECECPVIYAIAQKGKGIIWRQEIAYMSEYIDAGCPGIAASADQRKEAYEKWEELKGE